MTWEFFISQPLFSIFDDRIEIFSHGGLPAGQTKERFFKGVTHPRNDMLMRIFLQMNLTEHAGHGIPIILSKYGEDAFDITDAYINVTIPFDKDVMATTKQQENGGLNEIDKKVIALLLQNPILNVIEISANIGLGKLTIERSLQKLLDEKYIVRSGSKKKSFWIVVK